MSIDLFSFDGVHPLGHRATHPTEPLAMRQESLLLPRQAGDSHATRLGRFKRVLACMEPQLSA